MIDVAVLALVLIVFVGLALLIAECDRPLPRRKR